MLTRVTNRVTRLETNRGDLLDLPAILSWNNMHWEVSIQGSVLDALAWPEHKLSWIDGRAHIGHRDQGSPGNRQNL